MLLGDNIYADLETVDGKTKLKLSTPEKVAHATRNWWWCPRSSGSARARAHRPMWTTTTTARTTPGPSGSTRTSRSSSSSTSSATPADSPRRTAEGRLLRRIVRPGREAGQVILLDTRYFRSRAEEGHEAAARHAPPGRTCRTPTPDATMLGDEQWKWLEERAEEAGRGAPAGLQHPGDGRRPPVREVGEHPEGARQLYKLHSVARRRTACDPQRRPAPGRDLAGPEGASAIRCTT